MGQKAADAMNACAVLGAAFARGCAPEGAAPYLPPPRPGSFHFWKILGVGRRPGVALPTQSRHDKGGVAAGCSVRGGLGFGVTDGPGVGWPLKKARYKRRRVHLVEKATRG